MDITHIQNHTCDVFIYNNLPYSCEITIASTNGIPFQVLVLINSKINNFQPLSEPLYQHITNINCDIIIQNNISVMASIIVNITNLNDFMKAVVTINPIQNLLENENPPPYCTISGNNDLPPPYYAHPANIMNDQFVVRDLINLEEEESMDYEDCVIEQEIIYVRDPH